MDAFAGATKTGQEIAPIVGEAGTCGGGGDLRSPAVARTPGRPERRETIRPCACWPECTFNGTLALVDQKTHGPVTTTGEFLRAVENARALRGLTKAELARRSHVRAETVRHLLTADAANPTLTNALDMLRPLGLAVDLVQLPQHQAKPTRDQVYAWLSHYGAALYGSTRVNPSTVPEPETVLAEGLKLSRQSASVARALPVALWKNRQRLNMDRLRREAERRGQTRVLGFFLDLTTKLSGETMFAAAAAKLYARAPAKPTQFFRPTTWRERRLAELRTPAVARKWRFRMNMPMDSFVSMFEKGVQ